jgi:hypothetical protein
MLPARELLLFLMAWCLAAGGVLRRHVSPGGPVTPLAPLLLPVYVLFYTALLHSVFAVAHVEWESRVAGGGGGPASMAPRGEKFGHLLSDGALSDFVAANAAVFLAGALVSVVMGLRMKYVMGASAVRSEGQALASLRKEFALFALAHLALSLVVLQVTAAWRGRSG